MDHGVKKQAGAEEQRTEKGCFLSALFFSRHRTEKTLFSTPSL
jgi:hypothetical protein